MWSRWANPEFRDAAYCGDVGGNGCGGPSPWLHSQPSQASLRLSGLDQQRLNRDSPWRYRLPARICTAISLWNDGFWLASSAPPSPAQGAK